MHHLVTAGEVKVKLEVLLAVFAPAACKEQITTSLP